LFGCPGGAALGYETVVALNWCLLQPPALAPIRLAGGAALAEARL